MSENKIIVACQQLTFILQNTAADSASVKEAKHTIIRGGKKQLSLQVLSYLTQACMMRVHEILPAEDFCVVRKCCARLLNFDKANSHSQNSEVFCFLAANVTCLQDKAYKMNALQHKTQLEELIARCSAALFLLKCDNWESYENEQTLLKQVHRSVSMYIEELLALFISIALFALCSSYLLVEKDLVAHFKKVCAKYAKLSQAKPGIAEKASDSVSHCVTLLERLAHF
jgi:hypothetical protein